MRFDIITIFPKVFDVYFNTSIIGRAKKNNLIQITIHDLRDYTYDKHSSIDDEPYGGGAGMVLMAEPILEAVGVVKSFSHGKKIKTIIFSAKGKQFDQSHARECSTYDQIIMITGRYEGIDERVKEILGAEEVSVGPYILTDGELPAMLVVSAVTRLLPGAITFKSLEEESFWSSLLHDEQIGSCKGSLEYPHYTRPEVITYHGKEYRVPKVLLSGNHAEIEKWRKQHITSLT